MIKWQMVFRDEQSYKAEIVKDILEDRGMSPVLISKKDSTYSNFGLFEIHVSSDEVIKALKVIENDINFK